MAITDKLKRAATTYATSKVIPGLALPAAISTLIQKKPQQQPNMSVGKPIQQSVKPAPVVQKVVETKNVQEMPSTSFVQPTTLPDLKVATPVTPTIEPVRPITPAPTMLKEEGTTKPLTDEEIERSVLKKSLQKQYGNSLTDTEIDYLARKQMEGSKNKIAELEKAKLAQEEALKKLTQQKEADLLKKQEELRLRDEQRFNTFSAQEEANAKEAIARAQRAGSENLSTRERLLGGSGNLTSSVGYQAVRNIQEQTQDTINSIQAAKNAAIAYERARLQGASDEELKTLSSAVQQARDAEAAAMFEAESALQQAKLEAEQAGDLSRSQNIQTALDNLSAEKVKSKVDATLTKNINDGFLYDEFGQKVTDAEGKTITYESQQDLNDFITLKEGDTLIDPSTGLPVYQAPKKTEYQKIGDKTYQVVNGQLLAVEEPVSSRETVEAVTQAKEKVNLIDEILKDKNFDKVFGPSQYLGTALLPSAQEVKNKVDNLIGDLILDERGRLKGSGAISDFETKIIRQAASPLGRNLTEEQAKQVLLDLKNKFENVEKATVIQNATGATREEAGLYLENVKQTLGRYPTTQEIQEKFGFNQEEQTSLKGTDVSGIKDFAKVTTSIGSGVATGIERGSKFWDKGFDFVLSGGKGAPVKTPYSGTIVAAKSDGAWGNSVQLKLDNGEKIRLSHLDSINVKPGQRIPAGVVIGTQGNTGKTYGKTGIHVDITMYDKNGKPYTSQQVASRLQTRLA